METEIRDKDLQGVEKVLRRAGIRARKIAEQTNTPLVIYKDGKFHSPVKLGILPQPLSEQ